MLGGVVPFSSPFRNLGQANLFGLSQSALIPQGARPDPNATLDKLISDDRSAASAYGAANAAVTSFAAALQGILPAPLANPQNLPPPFAVPPPPATSPEIGAPFAPAANPVAALSATSSLPSVVTATAAPGAGSPSFSLRVSQIAQAQSALGAAVADPNNTVIGSGTLIIATGSYNATHNLFVANSRPAASVSVVNGSLNSIATAINASSAGVTATVIQDGAGYHLQLTSLTTGAANGFRVTVQDSDGSNTDTGGLSQLAYDPTLPVGAGQNLTLSQAAQDAVYTLNGHTASSPGNSVANALPGVTLTLYQPSPTVFYRPAPATIAVTPSVTALASAATTLLSAFNSLVGTLQSLIADKGPLPKDATVAGLLGGLKGLAGQDVSGIGTYTSLARLGFSMQKDGTLALDAGALKAAYGADPTNAVAIFNKIVQNLSDFANVPVASQYYTSGTLIAGQPLADMVGNQFPTGGALVDAQQGLLRDLDIFKPQSEAKHTATDIFPGRFTLQYAKTLSLAAEQQTALAVLAATGGTRNASSAPLKPRLSLVV